MEKCIIVAIADNNAIGRDNALLWHISEDMKFFRKTTTGSPVIMGRKTFESIGRPLPKRVNIVISRGTAAPEGTLLAHSLEEAFSLASSVSPDSHHATSSAHPVTSSVHPVTSSVHPVTSSVHPVTSSEVEKPPRCFVIGGGQIYAQALPLADRLIVTHVHTVIENADTFFPDIDPQMWKVESRSEQLTDQETGYDFEFVEYKRTDK